MAWLLLNVNVEIVKFDLVPWLWRVRCCCVHDDKSSRVRRNNRIADEQWLFWISWVWFSSPSVASLLPRGRNRSSTVSAPLSFSLFTSLEPFLLFLFRWLRLLELLPELLPVPRVFSLFWGVRNPSAPRDEDWRRFGVPESNEESVSSLVDSSSLLADDNCPAKARARSLLKAVDWIGESSGKGFWIF